MRHGKPEQQLIGYLTDARFIQERALEQIRSAAKKVGDPRMAAALRLHIGGTENQGRMIRECLHGLDVHPEKYRALFGSLSGKNPPSFMRLEPDTTDKVLAYVRFYQHLELAAYELLEMAAEEAGDAHVAMVAHDLREKELEMASVLRDLHADAINAWLAEMDPEDLGLFLKERLADVYATEDQALRLLRKAETAAGADDIGGVFSEHSRGTQAHQGMIFSCLRARGATPAMLKQAQWNLGVLNWGVFSYSKTETLAELAGFVYSFEQLEAADCELLLLLARGVGDTKTEAVAKTILFDERVAAEEIHSFLDVALRSSLRKEGAPELAAV